MTTLDIRKENADALLTSCLGGYTLKIKNADILKESIKIKEIFNEKYILLNKQNYNKIDKKYKIECDF
jgi:hypothetical protein